MVFTLRIYSLEIQKSQLSKMMWTNYEISIIMLSKPFLLHATNHQYCNMENSIYYLYYYTIDLFAYLIQ